jgi:hypothetical protein
MLLDCRMVFFHDNSDQQIQKQCGTGVWDSRIQPLTWALAPSQVAINSYPWGIQWQAWQVACTLLSNGTPKNNGAPKQYQLNLEYVDVLKHLIDFVFQFFPWHCHTWSFVAHAQQSWWATCDKIGKQAIVFVVCLQVVQTPNDTQYM